MAPRVFNRDLRLLLTQAGCHMIRQGKGRHEIWLNPSTSGVFPVPVGIASRHTANAILKQAGLPKVF